MSAREAVMDGELHVEGECCDEDSILGRACPRCGARQHRQPVYGGIADLCERCPADQHQWSPRGSHLTDDMHDGAGVAGSFTITRSETP